MKSNIKIRWEYEGKPDVVNGTGAYAEEKLVAFIGSAIVPILLIYLLMSGQLQWNPIQIVVAIMIGGDIGGGMVSNALNSCKRFYASPVKPNESKIAKYAKNHHMAIIVLHIHPIIIGLLYNMDWFYALAWYAIFITSILIVYKTPLYMKRAVSVLLTLIAILLNTYVIDPVIGFEWFIPMLFIKVISGHLIREEPYDKITTTNI